MRPKPTEVDEKRANSKRSKWALRTRSTDKAGSDVNVLLVHATDLRAWYDQRRDVRMRGNEQEARLEGVSKRDISDQHQAHAILLTPPHFTSTPRSNHPCSFPVFSIRPIIGADETGSVGRGTHVSRPVVVVEDFLVVASLGDLAKGGDAGRSSDTRRGSSERSRRTSEEGGSKARSSSSEGRSEHDKVTEEGLEGKGIYG